MSLSCAVIYGATGAVGSELLKLCLDDSYYNSVVVLARKPAPVQHPKLTWLTSLEDLSGSINHKGQVHAYCCLGTTIKQAGSREAFREVDHDLVVTFATHCRTLNTNHFCAVSAIGANTHSRNFYSRTKGEMEAALIALEFESLSLFRPSLLDTRRSQTRLGERIATLVLNSLSPLLFGKLRQLKPITPKTVAQAMIASGRASTASVSIVDNLEMHRKHSSILRS